MKGPRTRSKIREGVVSCKPHSCSNVNDCKQKAVDGDVPSVPNPFRLFAFGGVLLEGVDLVSDFQRNDIPVHERVGR